MTNTRFTTRADGSKVCLNRYALTSPMRKRFTLTIEANLDIWPGPWHEPEDLMKFIAQHSYVESVTLTEEED